MQTEEKYKIENPAHTTTAEVIPFPLAKAINGEFFEAFEGVRVFPLIKDLKKPATKHGYLDSVFPFDMDWTCNTGWVLGGQPYFGIDVDTKGTHKGATSLCEFLGYILPVDFTEQQAADMLVDRLDTLIIETPTRGLHIIFRHEGDFVADWNPMPSGCEFRGSVGYLVAPGAHLEASADPSGKTVTGDYRIIKDMPVARPPACVAAALKPYTGESISDVRFDKLKVKWPANMDSDDMVANAIEWLKARPPAVEGQKGDKHTHTTARWCFDFGLSPDMALELMREHFNPRCSPPWNDDGDLYLKVFSAYKSSVNGGKIHGGRPAASADSFDSSSVEDFPPGFVFSDGTINPGKSPATRTDSENSDDFDVSRMLTRPEKLREKFGALKNGNTFMGENIIYEYLVPGFIPLHGVVGIIASYGTGKSTLMDDLAFAVATDGFWLGKLPLDQSGYTALILPLEDAVGSRERFRARCILDHGTADLPDPDRLVVYEKPLHLMTEQEAEDFADWLMLELGERAENVVTFIDTWQRLTTGKGKGQMDDSTMQVIATNVEILGKKLNGPIIVAVHPPKAGKNATGPDELTWMGTGVTENSATGLLKVYGNDQGSLTIYVDKCRGERKGRTVRFRMVPAPTGRGTMAVVPEWAGGAVTEDGSTVEGRMRAAKAIASMFNYMEAAYKAGGISSATDDAGVRSVTLTLAVALDTVLSSDPEAFGNVNYFKKQKAKLIGWFTINEPVEVIYAVEANRAPLLVTMIPPVAAKGSNSAKRFTITEKQMSYAEVAIDDEFGV